MKPHIHFRIDKDLILAILVGVLGGLVALAMFFLSGYMVTQSALGAYICFNGACCLSQNVWILKSHYTLH